MRLFVSINLREELNGYLAGVQGNLEKVAGGGGGGEVGHDGSRVGGGCGASGGLRENGVRLKLAGLKSGFHLTLFFLGEVSVDKVLDLQKELRAISFEPFKLKFKKRLGFFKGGGGRSGGFIKAVFVDIDNEGEGFVKLLDLQKKVKEVVGRFGFKDGGASGGAVAFSPHITLARVGFCPADRAVDFEKAVLGLEVSDLEFDVGAFYLMESHLGAGGSKYDEVSEVKGSAL